MSWGVEVRLWQYAINYQECETIPLQTCVRPVADPEVDGVRLNKDEKTEDNFIYNFCPSSINKHRKLYGSSCSYTVSSITQTIKAETGTRKTRKQKCRLRSDQWWRWTDDENSSHEIWRDRRGPKFLKSWSRDPDHVPTGQFVFRVLVSLHAMVHLWTHHIWIIYLTRSSHRRGTKFKTMVTCPWERHLDG